MEKLDNIEEVWKEVRLKNCNNGIEISNQPFIEVSNTGLLRVDGEVIPKSEYSVSESYDCYRAKKCKSLGAYNFRINKILYSRSVPRLIAEAFLNADYNNSFIIFKDFNLNNFSASNLKIATEEEYLAFAKEIRMMSKEKARQERERQEEKQEITNNFVFGCFPMDTYDEDKQEISDNLLKGEKRRITKNGVKLIVNKDGTIEKENKNSKEELIFIEENEYGRKGVTIINSYNAFIHYSVDWLILQAFYPINSKDYNKFVPIHIDGDLNNNNLDNLAWFDKKLLHLGWKPVYE